MRDKYIFWPDEEERRQLAKSNEEKYHCPNTILYGDGTLYELMLAPQTPDRGDYHGRKMQWSLTTLILGDDECRVRYYLSGFPGCSHDNRVWRWSKIYKEKEKYFSPLQYVIMDTAFEPSDICVPTYKKQPVPDPDKEKFNTTVAKYRVKSEHLNGISKGRFPGALRRIRKVITNDIKSLEEILSNIECAFILHNMLIDLRDADDGEELEDEWKEALDEEYTDIDDPNRGDPDAAHYTSPELQAMNLPLPVGAPKDMRRTLLNRYIREHDIDSSSSSSSEDTKCSLIGYGDTMSQLSELSDALTNSDMELD